MKRDHTRQAKVQPPTSLTGAHDVSMLVPACKIEVAGDIDRPAAHHLKRALREAKARNASVVIVRLDTPGGLLRAAREMIKNIAAAPMPVIVFVHPSGAHAESAGVFVTLAGDVAAMAPGTNIGSATPYLPVIPDNRDERALLKTLQRKGRNDALALARSLAEQHGRNRDLAEQMVTKATNVSASEAERQELIDVVAEDERALLRKLEGFRLKGPQGGALHTAGLPIKRAAVDTAGDAGAGESGDETIRSFAPMVLLVFGIPFVIWLVLRGHRLWRRRRWLWRRWRSKRRSGHGSQ